MTVDDEAFDTELRNIDMAVAYVSAGVGGMTRHGSINFKLFICSCTRLIKVYFE